jgi:hypothetical protein
MKERMKGTKGEEGGKGVEGAVMWRRLGDRS